MNNSYRRKSKIWLNSSLIEYSSIPLHSHTVSLIFQRMNTSYQMNTLKQKNN